MGANLQPMTRDEDSNWRSIIAHDGCIIIHSVVRMKPDIDILESDYVFRPLALDTEHNRVRGSLEIIASEVAGGVCLTTVQRCSAFMLCYEDGWSLFFGNTQFGPPFVPSSDIAKVARMYEADAAAAAVIRQHVNILPELARLAWEFRGELCPLQFVRVVPLEQHMD